MKSSWGALHPSPVQGWVLILLSLLPLSQREKRLFFPSSHSDSCPAQPAAVSTLTLRGRGCPCRSSLQWRVSLVWVCMTWHFWGRFLLPQLWLPGQCPPFPRRGLAHLPCPWLFLLIPHGIAASSPPLPFFLRPLPLIIPTVGP